MEYYGDIPMGTCLPLSHILRVFPCWESSLVSPSPAQSTPEFPVRLSQKFHTSLPFGKLFIITVEKLLGSRLVPTLFLFLFSCFLSSYI